MVGMCGCRVNGHVLGAREQDLRMLSGTFVSNVKEQAFG